MNVEGRHGADGGAGLMVGALVCPRLVGRGAALTNLQRLVDRAVGGRDRRIIVIGGEAGIGKSRLVAEIMAYAREHGVRVLSGASFSQDRTRPFAPLVDLLRTSLDTMNERQRAAVVRPFARELAPLFPDIVNAPLRTASAPTEPDPEQQRLRLLLALSDCLLGALPDSSTGALASPTCLVVEDLHWSDDASLDLLNLLARGREHGAARRPLALIATYRAEEAGPALRSWLGQLDRERRCHEMMLGQSRSPVTRLCKMLEATLPPASPPVGLVDAIHDLAEGNPFHVEELLGALVTAGDVAHDGHVWRWGAARSRSATPAQPARAVPARRPTGPGPARELLTLAAVVGRRFDFTLLQQVAQVDERTLLALVKEQVSARLVVEEDDERFAFRHALTRQAVYSDLLTRERLALHRTVAEMAEQFVVDTVDRHVDELAYHFFEPAPWKKARRTLGGLPNGRVSCTHVVRRWRPHAAIKAASACQTTSGC